MFSDYPEIIFGFSEKKDGPMKLANKDGNQAVINRQNFFEKRGIKSENIVSAALANGLEVKIVNENDKGKMIGKVDALITNCENLVLAITVADCAPIYLYNPVSGIIALVHAGWRGVLGNIIYRTISVANELFLNNSKDWQVFVGPHIEACHFEVQEDVAEMFAEYPEFIIQQSGKMFVDLSGIIKKQLLEIGIPEGNIDFSSECTYCEDKKYFSWRRDKPQEVEAMVAYFGMDLF
jgi:polyphenol oxidase